MKVIKFFNLLEEIITPRAKENTEGAYDQARYFVALAFSVYGLTITENQLIKVVNCVWDKVNQEGWMCCS